MQPFSWHSPLVRALDFLNKLFLPGAKSCRFRNKTVELYNQPIVIGINNWTSSTPTWQYVLGAENCLAFVVIHIKEH